MKLARQDVGECRCGAGQMWVCLGFTPSFMSFRPFNKLQRRTTVNYQNGPVKSRESGEIKTVVTHVSAWSLGGCFVDFRVKWTSSKRLSQVDFSQIGNPMTHSLALFVPSTVLGFSDHAVWLVTRAIHRKGRVSVFGCLWSHRDS